MKIKEQTRKLAAGCSKHCFEVVDKTDEVSHIYTARRRWRGLNLIFEEYKLIWWQLSYPNSQTKTGLPPQMCLSPFQLHFWDKKIGRTNVLPTKNMLLKGNWFFTDTLGKLGTNKSLTATFTTSYLKLLQFPMSPLFLSHLWYDPFLVRIDNTVLNYDS